MHPRVRFRCLEAVGQGGTDGVRPPRRLRYAHRNPIHGCGRAARPQQLDIKAEIPIGPVLAAVPAIRRNIIYRRLWAETIDTDEDDIPDVNSGPSE